VAVSRRRGLAAYFMAACCLRAADAAAVVAVVLLAQDRGLGARTGVLAACLTFPHLAGPLVARLLDRAPAKRTVIATAGAVYGACLAGVAAVLDGSVVEAAVLLLLAGAAGPLLTGGLSSQLTGIVGGAEPDQRRAHGMDGFTYGVAATAGPAAVGAIATVARPDVALLASAAAAVVGAALVGMLPAPARRHARRVRAARVPEALAMLVRRPGLSRTLLVTSLTALPLGAVPLVAVASADSLSHRPADAAVLTAAFGLGNLAASTALVVLPLRGDPDRLVRRGAGAMLLTFGLGAVAPDLPTAIAAYAAVGATTGVLFAASLAARAAYSPAGAEAQVFVSMAGIKAAFSSLGAAVAGPLLPLGGPALFLASCAVTAVALAGAMADRRPAAG
jgi:MFS family permease